MKSVQDSSRDEEQINPYDPQCMASLKHWGDPPGVPQADRMDSEVLVDCGWGRLVFGQTYDDPEKLAGVIGDEQPGRRDIAMYMRDPHVVLSYAPQELFMDPSLTYRLDFNDYRNNVQSASGVVIRRLTTEDDEASVNRIYQTWGMVPCYNGFYEKAIHDRRLCILVAEEISSQKIVGVVTGVDHFETFQDPDNGSSLWALAVDQQCRLPRVGESLVRELISHFTTKGRRFIDLSVMHTNQEAIALYEKLGFKQVPVYCIKKKNSINEKLFLGPGPEGKVNIYARIIIDEARRRGIGVEILDPENGYFRLSLGGRAIVCRESLSELTSAVAMSVCDDKAVTRGVLESVGLRTPQQMVVENSAQASAFLSRYGRVVVKPASGEQGTNVFVDLRRENEVRHAVETVARSSEKVLIEEYVTGSDLRIIVIDDEVVAAAVRKPASICGTGEHTISELIAIQSRRREVATKGESSIPVDEETIRCVHSYGYDMEDTLAKGVELHVRKTANLHTGGTIEDVTERLHPSLGEAARKGARALGIPVVGFDFLVESVEQESYAIVEANERPGLANHEPQPTAERFIDLLFPQTKQITTHEA